jgi:anti-sigma factor RsiW
MKTVCAAIFSALWLLDASASVAFIAEHGIQMESNPLMRAVIDNAGMAGFAATKAGVLALWLAVHRHAHIWLNVSVAAVMVPVTAMAVVVAWGGAV